MTEQKFQNISSDDLSHSMVHYLLTIHKLKEEKGYARVTDIARHLDITKGSVSTAIGGLKKKNLVAEEEDSKFLFLTIEGHDQVHNVLSSRTLLYYFLKDFLKVEESVAKRDSCHMEHLLSPESREKFFFFLKDISENPSINLDLSIDLSKFKTSSEFIDGQKGDGHLE